MPLDADFSWKQTHTTVLLEVPLKGTPAKAVDIYATDLLVKVNFGGYLLQLDLLKAIDDTAAVAKIKQGVLNLKLRKVEPGPWDTLVLEGATKAEIAARRATAIEGKNERDSALAERVKDRKYEDERVALRKQMANEENERCQIDDLKAEEKRSAEEEVYAKFAELEAEKAAEAAREAGGKKSKPKKKAPASAPATPPGSTTDADVDDGELDDEELMAQILTEDQGQGQPNDPPAHAPASSASAKPPKPPAPPAAAEAKSVAPRPRKDKGQFSRATEADEDGGFEIVDYPSDEDDEAAVTAAKLAAQEAEALAEAEEDEEEEEEDDELAHVPDVRDGGVIKFNFTPRIFPTPMRESKATEEEDWIAKNRNHLRQNPQLKPQLDALDIEDSDPTWLKGKGDDFYRARDYRAAVNAYTTALEIDPLLYSVLSNRGACYLQLGELVRCLEDSDLLLTKLDEWAMGPDANPDDPKMKKLRVKALARRGTARCQQGSYELALEDYKRAVIASPAYDETLIGDLKRVDALFRCSDLKRQADASFGQGELSAAVGLYTEALEIEPTFVSAISNRAACHLALGGLEDAVKDCTNALALLEVDPSALSAGTHSQSVYEGEHMLAQDKEQRFLGNTHGANFGEKADEPTPKPLVPSGPVPPPGSAKRRTWVLKTIARRGAAKAKLGDLASAAEDYRVAAALDPTDENLQRDLETLTKQCEEERAAKAKVKCHRSLFPNHPPPQTSPPHRLNNQALEDASDEAEGGDENSSSGNNSSSSSSATTGEATDSSKAAAAAAAAGVSEGGKVGESQGDGLEAPVAPGQAGQ